MIGILGIDNKKDIPINNKTDNENKENNHNTNKIINNIDIINESKKFTNLKIINNNNIYIEDINFEKNTLDNTLSLEINNDNLNDNIKNIKNNIIINQNDNLNKSNLTIGIDEDFFGLVDKKYFIDIVKSNNGNIFYNLYNNTEELTKEIQNKMKISQFKKKKIVIQLL